MAIRTSQMMTSRSLICLLENQNGGKLQKIILDITVILNWFMDVFLYEKFSPDKNLVLRICFPYTD
jgi:hypothetical protein